MHAPEALSRDVLECVLVLQALDIHACVPLSTDYSVPNHDLVVWLEGSISTSRISRGHPHIVRRAVFSHELQEDLLRIPVEQGCQVCNRFSKDNEAKDTSADLHGCRICSSRQPSPPCLVLFIRSLCECIVGLPIARTSSFHYLKLRDLEVCRLRLLRYDECRH